MVRFPYRLEPSLVSGPILRPVAKVVLQGPNGKPVPQFMYIDSGSDHTLIPYRVGRFLGFGASGQTVFEVQGVNGAVGVIYEKAQMKIGPRTLSVTVAWAQVEHVPLLLGRTDVFDHFKITFHQKKKIVVFQ